VKTHTFKNCWDKPGNPDPGNPKLLPKKGKQTIRVLVVTTRLSALYLWVQHATYLQNEE